MVPSARSVGHIFRYPKIIKFIEVKLGGGSKHIRTFFQDVKKLTHVRTSLDSEFLFRYLCIKNEKIILNSDASESCESSKATFFSFSSTNF